MNTAVRTQAFLRGHCGGRTGRFGRNGELARFAFCLIRVPSESPDRQCGPTGVQLRGCGCGCFRGLPLTWVHLSFEQGQGLVICAPEGDRLTSACTASLEKKPESFMNQNPSRQAPRPPAAIVLDMDGLMFNTEDLYDITSRVVLGRRGREFTLELKRRLMGRPAAVAFATMREFCQLDDPIEVLQRESDEVWLELLPRHIEKLPGLDWLLETADSHDIPLAVATSSDLRLARIAIGQFDLWDRFRVVLTGDQVVNGKPHPEIYLSVAERLGVASEQMLVFEDSLIGSRAAVSSGAWTVAVPGVHNHDQDYSHVHCVVPSLDAREIRSLVSQWRSGEQA